MSFDFDLVSVCNHVVDDIQFFSFDMLTPRENVFLQENLDFRSKFINSIAYDMCPRCEGKGWYWDIQMNRNDNVENATVSPRLIRKRAKLKQEVTKFISTYMGENPFYPFYGVALQGFLGSKIIPGRTDVELFSLVDEGINFLLELHKQQISYQDVDNGEILVSFDDLSVDYDSSANTSIFLWVYLTNREGQSFEVNSQVDVNNAGAFNNNSFNSITSDTNVTR